MPVILSIYDITLNKCHHEELYHLFICMLYVKFGG